MQMELDYVYINLNSRFLAFFVCTLNCNFLKDQQSTSAFWTHCNPSTISSLSSSFRQRSFETFKSHNFFEVETCFADGFV